MSQQPDEETAPRPGHVTRRGLRPASGHHLDRYELLRPYARGGTASLWKARQLGDHGFEKTVAVKTILPHLSGDPRFREMLLAEAKIASSIDHPNVARILDLGERDEVLYLVMEWIDGRSLAELGKHLAPVKDDEGTKVLLRILADACAGLHAAHELRDPEGKLLSVVHRDVSPGNIVVDRHGMAKVIDFGLAKAMSAAEEDTDPDILKGKFAYMSPEYVNERVVDRRADVWAVGVILYRFLTGKSPFDFQHPLDTLRHLAGGAARPPLPETIPRSLAAAVDRAMAPNPDERFATAAELRDALEDVMRELGGPVSPRRVAEYIAFYAPPNVEEKEVDILLPTEHGEQLSKALPFAVAASTGEPLGDRRRTPRAAFLAAGALCICAGWLMLDSVWTGSQPPTPTSASDTTAAESDTPVPCPLPAASAIAEEPGEAPRRTGELSGKTKARPSLEARPPAKTTERSAVLDFGI